MPTHAKSHAFQPVIANVKGFVLLDATWSCTDVRLGLNGKDVLLKKDAQGENFVLEFAYGAPVSRSLIFPDIGINVGKNDAERLFVGTIADIDRMAQEGSWHNVIRAAGLLWQSLLDQNPLVHDVNRSYKIRLQFDVHNYDRRPTIPPDWEWIDLDPFSFPDVDIVTRNLDEFLNAPCLIANGVRASVQDLISACANTRGGRHFGKLKGARKAQKQSIIDWDGAVRMLGKEPSQLAVAGICRVSLRGLRPLVDAVTGSLACQC